MALSFDPARYPHPAMPDYHSCNEVYGTGIVTGDCQEVIRQIGLLGQGLGFPITRSHGAKVKGIEVWTRSG